MIVEVIERGVRSWRGRRGVERFEVARRKRLRTAVCSLRAVLRTGCPGFPANHLVRGTAATLHVAERNCARVTCKRRPAAPAVVRNSSPSGAVIEVLALRAHAADLQSQGGLDEFT
jgi:hypothetical protein